jgi:hypothetical protein
MAEVIPDLIRRQRATAATLAKYRAKEWSWKDGITCVHLARSHLREMGHKPEPMPRVRSLVAAKRALAERGCGTVAELLDAQPGLLRIAPAQMLLGDLAVLPGLEGLGAIVVCAGPLKLLGWHEEAPGMEVLSAPLGNLTGAWRI